MKFIKIAIDGFSSCGKSTVAKDLAAVLHYLHIDTGSMYRAITLFVLENKILNLHLLTEEFLKQNIDIQFCNSNGYKHIKLNNRDVETLIRSHLVSDFASEVAAISSVRRYCVNKQRSFAHNSKQGVVMEGRDIGTVVLPNAELKIFITADVEIRTDRRYNELLTKNDCPNRDEVKSNLLKRDYIDTNREDSPLRQASDAIVLDNSNLSREQQLEWLVSLVNLQISK